jgi:tight adherence protein B
MTRRRPLRALGGLALIAALFGAFPGAVAADPVQPAGHISGLHTKAGEVDLTLTVDGLPTGTKIDPSSVAVTAGGHTLHATVSSAQAVQSTSPDVVREVVLAFDTSGSMAGAGIAAARSAASAYARELPADVRIGLIAFSDRANTLLQPTTDRNALARALQHLSAKGNTSLYDAIASALNLIHGLPASAQRRLLVLSDGADGSSSRSLSDVLSALRSAKVPADVVAFRLPGRQAVLDQIAAASGGKVLPTADAGGLAQAFAVAAQAFGQRVQVAIQVPPGMGGDATLRVRATAGGQSMVAQTSVTLIAAQGSSSGTTSNRSAPTLSLHDRGLVAVLAIAFIGMLALALALLLAPVVRHERASWGARVAEAGRYRVVRSVGHGTTEYGPPEHGEGAVARRALAVVDRAVRVRGQREKLMSELERAGLRMRPEEWAVLQLATVLAFAAVSFAVLHSLIAVIAGGLLGWIACRFFIRAKIDRRGKAFEDQLPDNLQLLAGSLRSGFSLAQALGTVVREGAEPTASEFTRALTEMRLGADLIDALDRVADRMRCEDLRWVVMAIRISREVGGNLAEVLDNTVETMRERARLRGQVRVLTAEGRLSARILIGLPIFVGAVFVLIRPAYVRPLFHTTTGLIMFGIGVVELILGAVWLNRLTKIEV